MEAINKKNFKAIEFMRKVRAEMSTLYTTDKKRYFEEIQKAMTDFKAQRQKQATDGIAANGAAH